MWPTRKLNELVGTEHPIVQAPMAGANGSDMAIAVSNAGALGSLPCAMLDCERVDDEMVLLRRGSKKPVNMNFFCHSSQLADPARDVTWMNHLTDYYSELGLDTSIEIPASTRTPFDDAMCQVVEHHKPEVVSFHFGLPHQDLLERVKSGGSIVISSATTVEEAIWLEARGCDAIIAQGYEAGGHRGMFLPGEISTQAGTIALVPQVVDAVSVPVIAAGGITDGRGIAAAMALGAAGVQIGTAYLFTPESIISTLHRKALLEAADNKTALTNLFSGKPARSLINRLMREIGPISDSTPVFPTAGAALAPLKTAAEKSGKTDFSSLWAGQAASLGSEMGSAELTRKLVQDAMACFQFLSQTAQAGKG